MELRAALSLHAHRSFVIIGMIQVVVPVSTR